MDLPVIEMEKEQAEAAFKEYRDAVRSSAKDKYAAARRDYEAIDRAVMRGYKEIAKGRSLIRLSEAIRAGGTEERTTQDWNGKEIVSTLPCLAVCRADARHVLCNGLHRDGTVIYHADDQWSRARANTIRLDRVFDEPETRGTQTHRAIVPTIPPPFRPEHKLSGYHLLWEAEWDTSPPADPALLKHLGGDLYAVLAIWDLTELEQAVLGGLRAS